MLGPQEKSDNHYNAAWYDSNLKAENACDKILTLGKEIWNRMLPAWISIFTIDELRKETSYLQIGMKEKNNNNKPR